MLRSRIAVVATLVVVLFAGGLTLASCGGGDDEGAGSVSTTTTTTTETSETETTTETTTTEEEKPVVVNVVVVGGVPKDGIVRETVDKGDRVVLAVRADEADEVHVHGYDLYRDVGPGNPARIAFVAKLPGRFAVELHHDGTQIADLTVTS